MPAKIIDGKSISEKIRLEIMEDTEKLWQEHSVKPGLCVILVGDNPASLSYVTSKEKACKKMGFHSEDLRLSADTSEAELLRLIAEKNRDPSIHGILVQLPLPEGIDSEKVILRISPDKDVDGFHPVSVGKLVLGQQGFIACTPFGIMKLLEYSGIHTEGKHVVVLGRSNIVGKPIANLLYQKNSQANATVTICHSRTKNLSQITGQADILIAAIGRPGFVKADMVKEGAVCIDVGINRVEDSSRERGYRIVGDIDFEAVSEKASFITPVPKGVGPMTITMLLYNTLLACKRSINIK